MIKQTHAANYCAYGYRRTWIALTRAGEQDLPRCRVQRLMHEAGIQGAKRRGKPWRTTRPDPSALRAPDLVNRDFTAERPNALWVTDFTHMRCWEGVVYFSFVIDVYSRMIVGWQLAGNMRTTLVLDALRMALGLREHGADVQLVHHSDAGSQYTSGDYTQELTDHTVLGSIGTVGDCYDNALAESFVDSYKTELIADRVWRSRSELELASVEWVAWFNTVRLHSSLGDIPPVEFEALNPAEQPITGGLDLPSDSHIAPEQRPGRSDGLPAGGREINAPAVLHDPGYDPSGVVSDLRIRDILTDNIFKTNNQTTNRPN